jgi:calcium-translocating P-type ATPase
MNGDPAYAPALPDAAVADRAVAEPLERLLRDLRARPGGLSASEVERRRMVYGPNEIERRAGRGWLGQLVRQLVHPFAILLWAAALLATLEGALVLGAAIVAVVVVNAVVGFVQERQAERAVESLRAYLPTMTRVVRSGATVEVPARELVPGDVLVVEEGARIPADARLLDGTVDVDLSSLTGESAPVTRAAHLGGGEGAVLDARDVVFSGTSCVGGTARAVVFGTGMRSEIGRIAALSQRVSHEPSPLERQVRRLAWIVALTGLVAAACFLLIGTALAGLPLDDAVSFAIGLLVANVPEGLLPTLTLALALAVRLLAGKGAIVKRLSAVETLGATTVICTDKTGTITENRMQVVELWTRDAAAPIDRAQELPEPTRRQIARVMAACNRATVAADDPSRHSGDPTEVALLLAAATLGEDVREATRDRRRRTTYAFDPGLKMMSTIDEGADGLTAHVKGAPEEILARCDFVMDQEMQPRRLGQDERQRVLAAVESRAAQGLRVLALACRRLDGHVTRREDVERSLTLVGLVAMLDPPRAGVAEAVASCRRAGIRVLMITGDHGTTAAAIARSVGIVGDTPRTVTGADVNRLHDHELLGLLRDSTSVVFARASPETKLRIADALAADGHVVAMTGDGVNDAPALRRADIGIAMGASGTDVAREAATLVLTDDDFTTIVVAVREGRRVYDNIRKFIVYILAHLTPEVVPFLVFALSGGSVPLPLTVLQILAIDLGTETLPALSLGREAAEPGLMERPPRARGESIVGGRVLVRAWVLLGGVSALLVMFGFFFTLTRGGWTLGAPVGPGSELATSYRAATTVTFLGIVMCQLGTAFAARTERVSLLRTGVFSNRMLLWGVAFELVIAAAVVWVPGRQPVFHTSPPPLESLLLLLPFPFIVWGADELHRRHRARA